MDLHIATKGRSGRLLTSPNLCLDPLFDTKLIRPTSSNDRLPHSASFLITVHCKSSSLSSLALFLLGFGVGGDHMDAFPLSIEK